MPGRDLRACRSGPTATAAAAAVLGGEDVARHPADVGAQGREGLDQHGGLHRHVEAAHDLDAVEGLLALVALAQGHQPRHLDFGQADLLAAELAEAEVGDLEGGNLLLADMWLSLSWIVADDPTSGLDLSGPWVRLE